MRVLFVKGDLHVATPEGCFIVRRNLEVEWLTEYAPLKKHAGELDQEILAPGRSVPADAADALLLDGGRLAVVFADWDAPRVDVLDAKGTVETSTPLKGKGKRLRDVGPGQWDKGTLFSGDSRRGIRLFAAPGGFLVTANESGHVARFSLEERRFVRVLRVPGAPENTLYAACVGDDLLIGMKWNGRHSELLVVSPGDELDARWPDPEDEEVRWGMPAPAILGRSLVTYSDDGPHGHQLALLTLPDLEEVAHAPIDAWPADMATDGERFAAVATGLLVMGHVNGERIVVDERWTTREIMKRANVEAWARPMTATDDGRGARVWLDGRIDRLVIDGERLLLERDAGIFTLEDGGQTPILASRMRRALVDACAGRLLVMEGIRYRVLEGEKLVEKLRVDVTSEGFDRKAWLFEDGLLEVGVESEESFEKTFVLNWYAPHGARKELAWGTYSRSSTPALVLARGRGEVAWCELQEEDGESEYWLVWWSPRGKRQSVRIGATVRALAFDGEVLYARADCDRTGWGDNDHLYRVTREGTLERISKEPFPFASRELAVGAGRAFFTTGSSTNGDTLFPSQLFAIDLATGEQTILATAVIGKLRDVTVSGSHLMWLETPSEGGDEQRSSLCSLPL